MLTAGGQTATEVSEMLLEMTAKALLSNDFEAFALCFHVPHAIDTPEKKTILKTRSALQKCFDLVVEDYMNRRVTDLIRFCDVAEFRGPLKIEATHTTHMMSGNLRVVDPFPAFSIIEFIDDRWQITASQYAVDTSTSVGRALTKGTTETETPKRTTLADALEKRGS